MIELKEEIEEIQEAVAEADHEADEALVDEGLFLAWNGRELRRREMAKRFFRLLPQLPGFHWYAENVAPRHLRLERVTVPLPHLPPELAGLRIGLLTDIHHDLGRPLALLRKGVDLVNAAAPDLIVLGGDYIVSRAAGFDDCAAILGQLRAPLGVYAILGNHDYWAGGDLIAAKVEAAGPTVLRNKSCRVAKGDAEFWLIGLDDAARRRVDLDAAFAGVPEGSFRILLAHEPDVADHLDGRRVDLQLSGHTHGGQVVFPLVGPLVLPILGRRYLNGLDRLPTHTLYTSRGVGGVPPFARLNCPPEVTILTLVKDGQGAGSQG